MIRESFHGTKIIFLETIVKNKTEFARLSNAYRLNGLKILVTIFEKYKRLL
jgi:hypothetical protein